jgi:ABC-type sugar transport system ATPase subunit
MAEIRLEHVTITYQASGLGFFPAGGRARRTYGDYADKALVERMASQETATPSSEGPVKALDDLSLTIHDGETVAIVGPSGCGKSTLLKIVAGLEEPESGRVLYDGRDMSGVKPGDRGIGMVFQSYALYPHMKGEGNLGFFFKIRRRPSDEIMERIKITAEIMGLGFEDLLPRSPGTLSGGQQQRVAIGRCIVRDPSLFLFDEPLSNLDAKLRARTRVEIKRLLRRFHITSIYVTHDQTEAITLGDRIAVMRAGKIEQVGTYQELYDRPANAFVAGFVGIPPMNVIEGWEVLPNGRLRGVLGELTLPPKLAGRVSVGQLLTLGFRDDSGQVSDAAPESDIPDHLVFGGRVLNAEPDYARSQQILNLEIGEQMLAIRAPVSLAVNAGWTVHVSIPISSIHFFDQESEARLWP